ncbi:MAG: hypothetical protein Q4B84_05155 [Clostridia bacterium]|nr:hypothetical protein [Clostridia bacterium]
MRNLTEFETRSLRWLKNIFCVYAVAFLGLVAWYIYKNGFNGYNDTSMFLILMFIAYVIVGWMFHNFIDRHKGKNITTFELKIILFNYVQIMYAPFVYWSITNYTFVNLLLSMLILTVIIGGRYLVIYVEKKRQKDLIDNKSKEDEDNM